MRNSRSPVSSPLSSCHLFQLDLQLPQPRDLVCLRHVLMHVQPSAAVAEAANRNGPALLAGGEEPEEHAVSAAGEGGGSLAVVTGQHVTAISDAVGPQVSLQGLYGVRVHFASKELRAVGLHEQGEREVSDACIEVHHSLPSCLKSSHPRPLPHVSAAEHDAADVEGVADAVLRHLHPAVAPRGMREPHVALPHPPRVHLGLDRQSLGPEGASDG
mmetsp:Transcript_31071/g.69942  ORF Transcript_31071/g.69942 Transcript_31071/m.69942 type:complete len:215 (-) Transcript_31071:1277-1921(-)